MQSGLIIKNLSIISNSIHIVENTFLFLGLQRGDSGTVSGYNG